MSMKRRIWQGRLDAGASAKSTFLVHADWLPRYVESDDVILHTNAHWTEFVRRGSNMDQGNTLI